MNQLWGVMYSKLWFHAVSFENVTGMRALALKHEVFPPPPSWDGKPALGSVYSPDGSPHGVVHILPSGEWGVTVIKYMLPNWTFHWGVSVP